MEIIIDDNILDDMEIQFIKERITSPDRFPVVSSFTTSKKFPYFVHGLVNRQSFPYTDKPVPRSEFFFPAHHIFTKFCSKYNIPINGIVRAAINISFQNVKYPYGDIHVDLDFDHKVFLLYLNDLTPDPKTNSLVIFENVFQDKTVYDLDLYDEKYIRDNFTIKKEIHPKLGRAVCFDGRYFHTVRWPAAGELRYALVINFF